MATEIASEASGSRDPSGVLQEFEAELANQSIEGHWQEAARALEEGLELTLRMPYPYAEARLLQVYGLMHAAMGERGPARERLEEALAIFRRLGAHKDVKRVEQVVTDLQRH